MNKPSAPSRWIATDGGPLLVVPRARLPSWRGSFIEGEDGDFVVQTPGGPFAFCTDYDFENPRTDYERACRVEGLAGLIDVDGSAGLVVGDAPLETTWLALDDGGLLAGKITVEPGANLEAEVSVLGTAKGDWRDEGFTLEGGSYLLMDALDHGAVPEREPIPVKLPNGTCRVLTARVSTGLVVWSCIRLTQAKEV